MAARDTGSLLVVGLLLFIHTWGAWGAVEVNMEDRVEVELGDTAQITCMFTTEDGIGGTIIQWYYVKYTGEKQRIYYLESGMSYAEKGTPLSDRISVNGTGATGVVVLTIEDVQLKDELEFICIVKSLTVGTAEGRTKLRVFHTPEMPRIEGVQKGISVREDGLSKIGTCEVNNGYPQPSITWYKGNMPIRSVRGVINVVPSITTESTGLYSVKSELSMKVVKEDEDELFYCEIKYSIPGGTNMMETPTINVTVFYPHTALEMWIESPKGHIKEGDTVTIQCSGDGSSPSTFTISGPKNSSSDSDVLVVENVTRLNTGDYVCIALDMESFNDIIVNTSVVVNFLEDVVIKPAEIIVPKGGELQATCNALSSLPTKAAWLKNGQEVSKNHTLDVKDVTFDMAGTYECVVTAQEVEGLESSGAMRVHVEGGPKIQTLNSTEVEESMDTMVPLSCHVRGYPHPNVSWSTSEGKIVPTTSEKETNDVVISSAIVKVTGDFIVYCNATNTFGDDSVAFNIKAKSRGVIIAVIIVCILLLAILGSVLYFLYKKGKICGRSGKQDLNKGKSGKDNIVVEMKSDNTEEAVLLGVNGEKQAPNDQ
uniref:Melanoma cell adhesion molecule b n=1 Tax=Neogobius melanostomus TaxID=47308 RepID=A0A8C6T2M1_9GOBI